MNNVVEDEPGKQGGFNSLPMLGFDHPPVLLNGQLLVQAHPRLVVARVYCDCSHPVSHQQFLQRVWKVLASRTVNVLVKISKSCKFRHSPVEPAVMHKGLLLRVDVADPPRNIDDMIVKFLPNLLENSILLIKGGIEALRQEPTDITIVFIVSGIIVISVIVV
jgi:hypothetical protein